MLRLPLRAALRAAFVMLCLVLVLAPPASARPDADLGVYLNHLDRFRLVEWPAEGTLTDGFGPRWGRMHNGIDVGILQSLDLVAAAPGVVTETGYLTGFEGYGNVVMVDAGHGYETMYAHLSRVDVRVGQHVAAGDRIGLAGCTGSCTGTHLHFEVHANGRPVDPLQFLEDAR